MFVANNENSMKYDVENTCTENMDRTGLLAKTDKYTITTVENHKKN